MQQCYLASPVSHQQISKLLPACRHNRRKSKLELLKPSLLKIIARNFPLRQLRPTKKMSVREKKKLLLPGRAGKKTIRPQTKRLSIKRRRRSRISLSSSLSSNLAGTPLQPGHAEPNPRKGLWLCDKSPIRAGRFQCLDVVKQDAPRPSPSALQVSTCAERRPDRWLESTPSR